MENHCKLIVSLFLSEVRATKVCTFTFDFSNPTLSNVFTNTASSTDGKGHHSEKIWGRNWTEEKTVGQSEDGCIKYWSCQAAKRWAAFSRVFVIFCELEMQPHTIFLTPSPMDKLAIK